ncbi:hypothetical protein AA313_de0204312 [Arthrobotrys entomopaga]|nr:hypothetical protein AA313_de0204312 [Arthrobotrys entomopaga]
MIRLGASQMLLTNRDVTRTLKSNHPRRPPTFLYTKGKHPSTTSNVHLSPPAPHSGTRHPAVAPTMQSSSSSIITPGEAAPLDWSTSSGSEPSPSAILRGSRAISTDGTQDGSNSSDRPGNLRQIISLETVDSFPFLPLRPSQIQIYEDDPNTAYEDPEAVSDADFYDDSDDSDDNDSSLDSTASSIEPETQDINGSGDDYDIWDEDEYEEDEYEDEEEGEEDGQDREDESESSVDHDSEDGHASVVLAESIWDPNLTVVAPQRLVAPLLRAMDLQAGFQDDALAETGVFETPPPRENLL